MKPIETFQKRLEKALNIRNMKPVELHEKTGISESLLSKYLSGNAIARQRKIALISETLNINPVWLMGYDVPMEEFKIDELGNPVVKIPMLGTVKAGYDYMAQENWEGMIEVDKNIIKDGSDYFALKIKGDSMSPILIENDIVIIKKQEDFENGDLVVALVNGDEATIKKGRKSDTSILLQPFNTAYEPLIFTKEEMKTIPVTIIGVVKQLKRDF